jgi:hypothetical protein
VTLRRPPADSAELESFPVHLLAESYPYARIHLGSQDPERFCFCGDHRFDPSQGSPTSFGTCYVAGNPIGAFVDKFGDFAVVSRDRVDAHELS